MSFLYAGNLHQWTFGAERISSREMEDEVGGKNVQRRAHDDTDITTGT